jgi:hypothetical protein
MPDLAPITGWKIPHHHGHEQQQREELPHGTKDQGWLMPEMDVAEHTKKSTPLRTPQRLALMLELSSVLHTP